MKRFWTPGSLSVQHFDVKLSAHNNHRADINKDYSLNLFYFWKLFTMAVIQVSQISFQNEVSGV